MKVYIVVEGVEYEGSSVIGVFSSEELAQNCVKLYKKKYKVEENSCFYCDYEEHILDNVLRDEE